jgi:hypothetical protein
VVWKASGVKAVPAPVRSTWISHMSRKGLKPVFSVNAFPEV